MIVVLTIGAVLVPLGTYKYIKRRRKKKLARIIEQLKKYRLMHDVDVLTAKEREHWRVLSQEYKRLINKMNGKTKSK